MFVCGLSVMTQMARLAPATSFLGCVLDVGNSGVLVPKPAHRVALLLKCHPTGNFLFLNAVSRTFFICFPVRQDTHERVSPDPPRHPPSPPATSAM